MKTLFLPFKPILFVLLISIFFYQSVLAQVNESTKTHYELTLKAANNSRIRIEVIVVKSGKRHTGLYTTPVCIKYPSSDMIVFVKRLNSKKTVEYKLFNIDANQIELNGTSTTFSYAKFEVSNGFISVSKVD